MKSFFTNKNDTRYRATIISYNVVRHLFRERMEKRKNEHINAHLKF